MIVKTLQVLFMIMTLLITYSCNSQTPEQKEKQEKEQETKTEAEKQMDEVMKNNPQLKEMMEKMKAMGDQQKADKKKKQEAEQMEKTIKQAQNREDSYWKNKVASNTSGKFNNWKWGKVDIAIYDGNGKMDSEMQYIDKKYIIVGNINSNGQVTMNLPESIRTLYPISKSLIREMHRLTNEDVNFSNPDALFRNLGFSLSVIKDYKKLGDLYIGNSEKVTYNLAAPCCLNYGDEGYRLYWVYIKDACIATYNKDYVAKGYGGKILNGFNQSIIYNLDFKPGWNLIKSEVIGNYTDQGENIFKQKKHTALTSLPTDAKYYFKYD